MRHHVWYTDILTALLEAEIATKKALELAEKDDEDEYLFPNLNVNHSYLVEEIERLENAAKQDCDWTREELPKHLRKLHSKRPSRRR